MDDSTYIQILTDSLVKKIDVLKRIVEWNVAQTEILSKEPVDLEQWEECVNRKADCIAELNLLDEGFETVYEKVRQPLSERKQEFTVQIKELKRLVGEITDLSVSIQTQEARNKTSAQQTFAALKRKTKSMKQSRQVSDLYDASMKKLNLVDAQFLDSRK